MGSDRNQIGHTINESPQRKVEIDYDFEVGKFPVTFREWDLALKLGFRGPKLSDQGWGRGRRPVINVSFNEAQFFIEWLNSKTSKQFRLLSEAEWEYVCRASTITKYSFGNSITHEQARFASKGPIPVHKFPANQWGVVGMHGNVFEWCQDCWNENYIGAPTDGSAWEEGDCNERIWRGGAWGGSPDWLRSATRFHYEMGFRYCDGGFRLARTLD